MAIQGRRKSPSGNSALLNRRIRFPAEFKIRRLEDIVGETDLVHQLHWHDFFFILTVQKGTGQHTIDFTPFQVQNHSVFYFIQVRSTNWSLRQGVPVFCLIQHQIYFPKDKNFC